MKLTHLIFALLCPLAVWSQKTIEQSQMARFQAMQSQDTLALQRLLHKDLIYVHSNALRESKADFIHSVSSGKIRYLSLEPIKTEIVRSGRNGTVNGEVQVKGQFAGNVFEMKLRYLATYKKKGGRWVLYRWQSTKM